MSDISLDQPIGALAEAAEEFETLPDHNRIVIVTGAAGGVGRTVTKAWLDTGACVLAVDATESGHDALASGSGETDRLATYTADLTTEAGANSMLAYCIETFGIPDTLVHLVGEFDMGPIDAPSAPRIWHKMMTLNLTAPFCTFRAMIPAFREKGFGHIVAITSRSVKSPPAQMAAYSASKAGLEALAHSMSDELKAERIHVNLIVASTIDTPANRAAMGEKNVQKWVSPQAIADATMFLCSEKAGSIYGATLEVFGLG
jgi:NAD(P)-dependent dehydrogenase (short-subunit alcohol dehydrogenase family)